MVSFVAAGLSLGDQAIEWFGTEGSRWRDYSDDVREASTVLTAVLILYRVSKNVSKAYWLNAVCQSASGSCQNSEFGLQFSCEIDICDRPQLSS